MVSRPLVALALLLLTAFAGASEPPPSQVAWARAALERLPVSKHDRTPERLAVRAEQLDAFALAIAEVSSKRPEPRKYAALMITLGGAESNFDTQIVLGICKPWMCDRGRAKGAFQGHSVSFTKDLWPHVDGDPRLQVEMADRVLRRSLTRCAAFAPFPAHVFRAYKGGGASSCSWPLKDEQARVATFNRLMRVSAPAASTGS